MRLKQVNEKSRQKEMNGKISMIQNLRGDYK